MRRHSTAILIGSLFFVGIGIDLKGINHKRAIKEQYQDKVFYIYYAPGFYGTQAGIAYEHTYHVALDGSVQFRPSKMVRTEPKALLPRGAQVEIRSVKVNDDRIEMTIRSLKPVSLGTAGLILGGIGAITERSGKLEVNLRFDVGKDTMKTGDMANVQKFVGMLISEERPQINIQVGMKLEEVTAQLGEPEQQIQVENKLLLVYPHLTVITEDGKVTEVKVK